MSGIDCGIRLWVCVSHWGSFCVCFTYTWVWWGGFSAVLVVEKKVFSFHFVYA